MKNSDANDPLKENAFDQEQKDLTNKEPLKEEKKTQQDPPSQENEIPTPDETAVAKSKAGSDPKEASKSLPQPQSSKDTSDPSDKPASEEKPPTTEEPAANEEPAPASIEATTDTKVPAPANEEPAPAKEEPVPAKEETPPSNEKPAPAKDEPAPAKEETPPASVDPAPDEKKAPTPTETKSSEEPTPDEKKAPTSKEPASTEAKPMPKKAGSDKAPTPKETKSAEEPTPDEKKTPTPKDTKSAEEPAPDEKKTPTPKEPASTEVKPVPKEAGSDKAPTPTETESAEEPAPDKKKAGSDKVAASAKEQKKAGKTADQELIDDHEEKKINASWDDDVDHEDHEIDHKEVIAQQEKEATEEVVEPKVVVQEEERVNFSLLSKVDLVKLMREKLDNPGKGNIRKDVEEIKQAFYEKVNSALEEKKKHFLEEGGNLEDFKPVEDPNEMEMKELLHKYKGIKAEFTRQLEKTKQENLAKKQEILENLRILMEGQETFEITFRKFKDLQKQWFSAGVVPQQNLKDLWDSYNYFVDKFNDYVRINRELRALDLKKNLELKVQLCERTEQLDQETNIVQAFKTLQKHHARWREIGPVPRENRDEIWDRFKLATSAINKKHQDYHSRLKESLHENLNRKAELCEKVETIAAKIYETHGAWVEKTNVVLEIQKTWKTIGYAPKKDNNAIYARFRKACDTFFGNKANFYASAYEEQKQNLKLKLEITEKAESLSTSDNWKETTTELIRLQKQWKEIGPVPRRDSDKLWKRFRAACDTFFHRKSKYFEDIDSTFDDNLKAKENLVQEMDQFNPSGERKKDLEKLEGFQTQFNAIGYVPASKKDWIKEQFRMAQDRLLEKMGMDESERSIFKFRHRIKGMINAPRSDMKLNFERDKLVNKLQQLKSDIGVWENNIGFFKQSDSSEETIQGFHEKIEAAHERIRVLEQKIRILDNMENAN